MANEKLIKTLFYASRLNITPLRLEVWPDHAVGTKMIENYQFNPEKQNSDKFHIGAVKLIADGSIQGYTGYLIRMTNDDHAGRGATVGEVVLNNEADNVDVARVLGLTRQAACAV